MLTRQWAIAVSVCLALSTWGLGQTPTAAAPDAVRVGALVRKLGSSSFPQREQARKELEAIGTPALEPLRRAKRTTDAETNRRIDELIRLFEEQLLTRQILAPKQVHLKVDAVTVQQAIVNLANLSGYPIHLQGDASALAGKKIKLDSGKTSFWQALDQLCDQAGLMEQIDVAAPPQVQPVVMGKGGKRRFNFVTPSAPVSPSPIVLVQRGNTKSLVSYAGSVKTEVRIRRDADTKELILLFGVSAEPGLLNASVIGRPVIDRAVGEQSRKLPISLDSSKAKPRTGVDLARPIENVTVPEDVVVDMEYPGRRITYLRLNDGKQTAKQLKELTGKLTLQLDLQNDNLAKIDKVLDAAGKSTNGANGGTLKVQSVKKLPAGGIEVQVSMENLTPNPFSGNVIVNQMGGVVIRGNVNLVIVPNGMRMSGGGHQGDLPDLLDAKGQKYQVGAVTNDSFNFVNGSASRTATIVYQPSAGQAEPRELVLFGTRTHTIAVPFRFENLPLP